jgi:steroid 5-alpha reductase family enzyme
MQIPPWLFQIVNLTFISAIQNVLLLLLGLPTRTVALFQPRSSLETSDYVLASLALLVLFLEFTADNQQYAYQTYKHAFLAKEKGATDVKPYDESKQWIGARLSWTPDDARRGFITRGLWRYSRHPNFACEQLFWVRHS